MPLLFIIMPFNHSYMHPSPLVLIFFHAVLTFSKGNLSYSLPPIRSSSIPSYFGPKQALCYGNNLVITNVRRGGLPHRREQRRLGQPRGNRTSNEHRAASEINLRETGKKNKSIWGFVRKKTFCSLWQH